MNEVNHDIAFTIQAGKDLRNIRQYLTRHASASVAQKVIGGIFDAIQTLAKTPTHHRPEPLLAAFGDYRVMLKGKYKIYFEFTGHDVIIARIVHAKRDFKQVLKTFKG